MPNSVCGRSPRNSKASLTLKQFRPSAGTSTWMIALNVSSLYDPLKFAAPFILRMPAKRLLQQLCKERIGWDEDVPPSVLQAWERWLNDLPLLRSISIPRYLKPRQLGPLKSIQLHHFPDALFAGYGVVSYLRFEDVDEKVNCALVMAKSRVAPIKPTTIPRLELTAATVAVKQHRQISQELDLKVDSVKFWTDSTCVLQYINNESNRFKTFVANQIAIIHELSSPSCWRFVDSKANPADHASRGLRPTDTRGVEQLINDPDFLWCDEGKWPVRPKEIKVLPDDALEWKKDVSVYETRLQQVDRLTVSSNIIHRGIVLHGSSDFLTIYKLLIEQQIPAQGYLLLMCRLGPERALCL